MASPATSDNLSAQAVLVQCLVGQPASHALFLDVDGTLIDIAATPDTVAVPDALPALVDGLSIVLKGALALVSGRTLRELDRLFAPLKLPGAGGHGAHLRLHAGGPVRAAPVETPLHEDFKRAVAELATADDRLLFEDKKTSVALHFRAAPERAAELGEQVARLLHGAYPEGRPRPDIIAGKMIYEIKAPGFDKGRAVASFLREVPFTGRSPIMIGDDTTDEAAFAEVTARGGLAFSVGREMRDVAGVFESPMQVRMALAQALSGTLDRHLSA